MDTDEDYFKLDAPIKTFSQDSLERSLFISSLVSIIEQISVNEKFIIGLDGEWGTGKTSCMYLLKEELLNRDSDVVCININAWSYNGNTDSILLDIFCQLEQYIINDSESSNDDNDHNKGCIVPKILHRYTNIAHRQKAEAQVQKMGGVLNSLASIFSDANIAGIPIRVGELGTEVLRTLLANSTNFNKMNKEIRKKLDDKKVLVVIDDIDRLDSNSVVGLLSAISTVSSFDGFIYMLPFDSNILNSCISEYFGSDTHRQLYFEKIVQLCIKLPKTPSRIIARIFITEFQSILARYNYEYEDIDRESKMLEYCNVMDIIETPRDIKRIYISAYCISNAISRMLSLVDIIYLETIRIKEPRLHDLIYRNKDLFVRTDNSRTVKNLNDKRSRINEIFEKYPKYEKILRYLFAYMASYMNSNIVELDSYSNSISNPEIFQLYYTLIMNENTEELSLVESIVSESKDIANVCDSIRSLSEYEYSLLIEYARGHLEKFDNLEILYAMLDRLSNSDNVKTDAVSLDYTDKTLFLFDEIIHIMNNKLEIYINLLKYAQERKYISLIPALIRQIVLYGEGGKSAIPEIGYLLDVKDRSSYIKEAILVIKWAFENKQVPVERIGNNNSALYYHYGYDYLGESYVKRYTEEHVKDADGLLKFFLLFIGTWSTLGKYDYHYGFIDNPTYDSITKYIDEEYAYSLLINNQEYRRYINNNEIITDISLHGRNSDKVKQLFAVGNESHEFYVELAKQYLYIFRQRRDARSESPS